MKNADARQAGLVYRWLLTLAFVVLGCVTFFRIAPNRFDSQERIEPAGSAHDTIPSEVAEAAFPIEAEAVTPAVSRPDELPAADSAIVPDVSKSRDVELPASVASDATVMGELVAPLPPVEKLSLSGNAFSFEDYRLSPEEKRRANEDANRFDLSEVTNTSDADSEPGDGTHMTGAVEPTPEQKAREQQSALVVSDVQLNKIGFARINAERTKNGLSPLVAGRDVQVVPIGRDVVSTPAIVHGESTAKAAAASAITGAIMEDDIVPQIVAAAAPIAAAAEGEPALPAAVDNSTLQFFPPIRNQGSLGSCAQWASIYYNFTHETAMLRGWDAKTGGDFYRFSPLFSYNFVNDGLNKATQLVQGWNIAKERGIPRWSQFYTSSYTVWCTNASVYRSALVDRADRYAYINDVDTEAGLNQLKEFLNNGHTAAYYTWFYSWQWKSVADDPGTSADNAYVGKGIVSMVNGMDGGHAMTVVGYNDDIWCDINADGVVDGNEKGALRVANSHGTTWKEGGFSWISYNALRVRNPAASSQGIFWDDSVSFVSPRATQHVPKVVASVTVNHSLRNQVFVMMGIGDVGSSTPSRYIFPEILSCSGGPYAFNGSAPASQDFTYYLDFTDLAPAHGETKRWFVMAQDTGLNNGNLTLKDFRLFSSDTGTDELVRVATNLPLEVNGAMPYVWVDWTMGDGRAGVEVVAVDANASEATADTGTWVISRIGDMTNDLPVHFSLSGAATSGTDYTINVTSPVTIPAGASNVTITLTANDDSIHEGHETALLTLTPNSTYVISGNAADAITIADDDNIPPIADAGADQTVALTDGGSTISITVPNDGIVGFQGTAVGGNSSVGNWPATEDPSKAVDGNTGTKYLNFGKAGSGFYVTPGIGLWTLSGIKVYTANDAPERDPLTISIEGASGGDLSQGSSWTLIQNNVDLGLTADPGRQKAGPLVTIANSAAYQSYRVIVQSLRNTATANSVQYSEFELHSSATTAALDGAVTDADGDTTTVVWSVVSKPTGAIVSFDNSSLLNPTVSMSGPGTYVLRLTATDGIDTTYDEVTITVTSLGIVTVNHEVPHAWLEGVNPAWSNDFEAAVLDDPDGDGFTTWQEYWSGTDPQDSNSYLHIQSVRYDGTNVVLEWQHALVSVIPAIVIQSTTNLAGGVWVSGGQKTPVNGLNSWSNPVSQAIFFRLAVTNAP